jgi:hypothetical protein
MCFVWISEQTAIISLYSINWLVFIPETECVYCAVRAAYIIPVNLKSFKGQYTCKSTYKHNMSLCLKKILGSNMLNQRMDTQRGEEENKRIKKFHQRMTQPLSPFILFLPLVTRRAVSCNIAFHSTTLSLTQHCQEEKKEL